MTSIEEWNDEPNYGEDFDSEFYKVSLGSDFSILVLMSPTAST